MGFEQFYFIFSILLKAHVIKTYISLDEIFPSVSIPTEMGYIQPLVKKKIQQNCVILTYVRSFLAYMTQIINILHVVVKVRRIIKYFFFFF